MVPVLDWIKREESPELVINARRNTQTSLLLSRG